MQCRRTSEAGQAPASFWQPVVSLDNAMGEHRTSSLKPLLCRLENCLGGSFLQPLFHHGIRNAPATEWWSEPARVLAIFLHSTARYSQAEPRLEVNPFHAATFRAPCKTNAPA